jgi:putative transcriptional regulator
MAMTQFSGYAQAVRKRLGLTQAEFSAAFRIPLATIREWEQGRRQPRPSARLLYRVIEHEPEAVKRALQS